jgi:hypothetical protein
VPDRGQQRTLDRDNGSFLGPAGGEPSISDGRVSVVLFGDVEHGRAKRRLQIGVAVPDRDRSGRAG